MNVYDPSLGFNGYHHFIDLVISPPSTIFLKYFHANSRHPVISALFQSAFQVGKDFLFYITIMPLSRATESIIII